MSDERDMYAFGKNVVGSCMCPATKAGFNTADARVNHIAGKFDKLAGESEFVGETGTLTDNEAKELWFEVISKLDREEYQDIAIEIAEENGWR